MPQVPHDVTIFPIYDSEHRQHTSPQFLGCLVSDKAIAVELPPGAFIDSLRKARRKGHLKLTPGHYLLLEFSDDIEEFTGLVFTVTKEGETVQQCLSSSASLNLSTWPPKSRV